MVKRGELQQCDASNGGESAEFHFGCVDMA